MEARGSSRAFKDSTAAGIRKELACPRKHEAFMDARAFCQPQFRHSKRKTPTP
jgi:hypothetical protein